MLESFVSIEYGDIYTSGPCVSKHKVAFIPILVL